METNLLYSPAQSGFRRNRGCADQIARLSRDAALATSNFSTVAVFLDVEKAYDMVWREGIINRMIDLGIPSRMTSWTRDFLSDRLIQVRVGTATSSLIELQNGTPQGSAISPILFNILMSAIPESSDVSTSIFADDIAIWKLGQSIPDAVDLIQSHLDDISEVFDSIGLKISPTKSQHLIIARSAKQRKTPAQLAIGGLPIPRAHTVKFLGMTFDETSSWNRHAEEITKKAESRLNAMRAISGMRWGANKSTLLTLYKALIRTLLDYGCEALEYAPKSTKKALDRIQSKALALCCGTMRGTPIAALQIECGEPPLELRRRRLITNLAAKCLLTRTNPARKTFFPPATRPQWIIEREANLINRMQLRNPTGYGPFLPILEELDRSSAYSLDPPEDPPWNSNALIDPTDSNPNLPPLLKPDTIACFTDASVIDHATGLGIFIPHLRESHALRASDGTSTTTAELLAVCLCLSLLEDSQDWSEALILTDSKSTLEAITGTGKDGSSPIADRTRHLIRTLRSSGKSVSVYRIPAHAELQGNEEADRLAREGTRNQLIDMPIPISYEDIRARSLLAMTKEWQERWDKGSTGREFKSHKDRASVQIERTSTHRHKEIMLTRLRMGHNKLNAGLHKIQLHPTGECQHCPGEKEDSSHVLMKCPARSELHKKLIIPLGANLKNILDIPWNQDIIFHWLRTNQPGGV